MALSVSDGWQAKERRDESRLYKIHLNYRGLVDGKKIVSWAQIYKTAPVPCFKIDIALVVNE